MSESKTRLELLLHTHSFLKTMHLTWQSHELCALIGANGAGKSTLLRLLIGEPPTEGVSLDGKSSSDLTLAERCKLMAWLPQETQIVFAYRAFDILLMGRFAHHHGFPSEDDREICRHWASRLDLLHLLERSVLQLSTGERRKLMIARLAVSEAPILLLDEPLANLDPKMKGLVMRELQNLQMDGRTIIYSTHDLDLLDSFRCRVIALSEGELFSDLNSVDNASLATLCNELFAD